MTPESLRRARSLIAEPGIAAVSFDLFDTLILRRCTSPDGVYERALAHAPVAERARALAESFVQHRAIAEYKARVKKAKAGLTEVSIDEIYEQMPLGVFGASPAARPGFAAAEFAAERELCLINTEILGLVDLARRRGLRVGFVSDTYWSRRHLERLLGELAPVLDHDFLYPSCEHGLGKAFGLFRIVLAGQGLEASQLVHVGDNAAADVEVPAAMGIRAVHYPQLPPALSEVAGREELFARMTRGRLPWFSQRLDGGVRLARRIAGSRLMPSGPAAATGSAVLGPVFAAFHRFVADRVTALAAPGRAVKVAFLARDAFLPLRLWQAAGAGEAHYVEINRRVALVGCSDQAEPLQDLFSMMKMLDRAAVEGFLKTEVPTITRFFAERKDGQASGLDFARELPALLDDDRMAEVSRATRRGMIAYLRDAIPGFDECTDLVLVDLGYSGTIQRALRGVLDLEGIGLNLHGVYLATIDDMFAGLREGDSAAGMLDDTILTPFAKRVLLRNIAVVEQCASAPVGSVLDYLDGEPVREDDIRPRPQIERCFEVQEGCLAFFDAYRRAVEETGLDPLDGGDAARAWAGVILCRFLMLPTATERRLLGPLLQDVNLGSSNLVPMIESGYIEAALGAMPFPMACGIREQPMWLGGSLAAVTPLAGYAYAMLAEGLAPLDLFADEALGPAEARIVSSRGAVPLKIDAAVSAFGDIRLRIPVPRGHQDGYVAIGLAGFLARGVIKTLVVQRGDDIAGALTSGALHPIPLAEVRALRARLVEHHFRAEGGDSHLLIPVRRGDEAMAVVTLLVAPLYVAPPEDRAAPDPRGDEDRTEPAALAGEGHPAGECRG